MTTVGKSAKDYSRFEPRYIPNCVLWLDGADSSTITISSGTSVSQWTDKSGNGDNATQSNASLQPTYSNSELTFNGTSQYMSLSSPSTLPSGSSPNGTYFFVSTLTRSSAVQALFMYGPNTLTTGANPQFYYDTSNYLGANTFGTGVNLDNVNTLNTKVILSSTIATSGINGFVSGWRTGTAFSPNPTVSYTTVSITSEQGLIGVTKSGSGTGFLNYYFQGSINEIVIYDRILSLSEQQQVEGYLAWKWGNQTSLPITHLYPSSGKHGPYLTMFRPTDFSNCTLWLDAADATKVSGSTVSTWTDKSVSANNAITLTTAPTYGTFSNGRPAIAFNGSQGLQVSDNTKLPNGANSAHSFFCITESTNNAVQGIMTWGNFAANDAMEYYFTTVGTPSFAIFQFNQASSSTFDATTISAPTILSGTANSTSVVGWRNGTVFSSPASGGLGANIGTTVSNIGCLNGVGIAPLTGKIGEIVIFQRVVTTKERQVVEGYLAWKWGVTSGLPSTHPFKNFPPMYVNP